MGLSRVALQIQLAIERDFDGIAHAAALQPPNYQLDLFDPNDGHYEYSAVTSNLALTVRNVWYFACGRGNHEKTIAQLKTGLAFHSVPTQTYAANSAWQQLVVLAHNLLTNFRTRDGRPAAGAAPGSGTVVPLLQSVQTLRFELIHGPQDGPPRWRTSRSSQVTDNRIFRRSRSPALGTRKALRSGCSVFDALGLIHPQTTAAQ